MLFLLMNVDFFFVMIRQNLDVVSISDDKEFDALIFLFFYICQYLYCWRKTVPYWRGLCVVFWKAQIIGSYLYESLFVTLLVLSISSSIIIMKIIILISNWLWYLKPFYARDFLVFVLLYNLHWHFRDIAIEPIIK